MKNIHILPTDKPSRIFITKKEGLGFDNQMLENIELDCQNQNLYITSDEEIKEGDWTIYLGNLVKVTSLEGKTFAKEYCKKIILTTDQDLIKDGVQAIDDDFLEWFVKNPSCEFVNLHKKSLGEIERELVPTGHDGSMTESDFNHWLSNGGSFYLLDVGRLKTDNHPDVKHISTIEKMKPLQEQWQKDMDSFLNLKQETLQEAAEKYATSITKKWIKGDVCNSEKEDIIVHFVSGAKWQQEQDKNKYSEEEVGEIIYNVVGELAKYHGVIIDGAKLNNLFEQFKKK